MTDLTKIAGGILPSDLEAGTEEEIWRVSQVTETEEDWQWVDRIDIDARAEAKGIWDGYARYSNEQNNIYTHWENWFPFTSFSDNLEDMNEAYRRRWKDDRFSIDTGILMLFFGLLIRMSLYL